MKRNITLTLSSLLFLCAAPAFAGEQYDVSDALRKKFAAQHAKKQRPLRSTALVRTDGGKSSRAVGRLDRAEDGMVLISVELTAAARRQMIARGVRKAKSERRIADGTIFGKRFYRAFPVAPDAVDDGYFSTKVGRRISLELARTESGRHVVVGLGADLGDEK